MNLIQMYLNSRLDRQDSNWWRGGVRITQTKNRSNRPFSLPFVMAYDMNVGFLRGSIEEKEAFRQ